MHPVQRIQGNSDPSVLLLLFVKPSKRLPLSLAPTFPTNKSRNAMEPPSPKTNENKRLPSIDHRSLMQNGSRTGSYAKNEHPLVRDTFNRVTCALMPCTSPNTQPIQVISTARDHGFFLSTWFSNEDNVARATKRRPLIAFYLRRTFVTLFLPLHKAFIRALNM